MLQDISKQVFRLGLQLVTKAKSLVRKQELPTERLTPQEGETEALRATMRNQFLKLKEKGLSIRIITL